MGCRGYDKLMRYVRFKTARLAVRSAMSVAVGASLFSIAMVLPEQAAAQGAARCACVLPSPAGPASAIGSITSASGRVLLSDASGFRSAGTGASLFPGSHVIVGPAGSAGVSLGAGCALNLAANAELQIVRTSGNLCVRMSQQVAGDPPPSQSPGPAISLPQVIMGGTMAIGAGIGLAERSVSR